MLNFFFERSRLPGEIFLFIYKIIWKNNNFILELEFFLLFLKNITIYCFYCTLLKIRMLIFFWEKPRLPAEVFLFIYKII